MIADKNMEQSVFDIMILHKAELQDFSAYENVLDLNFPVQSSYVYSIYTDNKNSFLAAAKRLYIKYRTFGLYGIRRIST